MTRRREQSPASACGAEFAGWVRPSLLPMTRLARRLAPHTEPDEVVQDSLERAWRKWHQFDPDRGGATAWRPAITADRARRARRAQVRRAQVRRNRATDENGVIPDSHATADAYHRVEQGIDLADALAGLTERQRLAVDLYYYLDLPVGEVAAVMACSPGTVKSTLFDARSALRERLEADRDD